jgi:hypothetical protein
MKMFGFGTFLSKSVLVMVEEVSLTSLTPWPAPVSSPELATQVRSKHG